jgi:hypothetical protein
MSNLRETSLPGGHDKPAPEPVSLSALYSAALNLETLLGGVIALNDTAMSGNQDADTKRAISAMPVFLETLERLSGELTGTISQIERRGIAQ